MQMWNINAQDTLNIVQKFPLNLVKENKTEDEHKGAISKIFQVKPFLPKSEGFPWLKKVN